MTTSHIAVQMPQQEEAPTYNHPCGDLIDGGRRDEYHDIVVPLYQASVKGDWGAAEAILRGKEYLVRYSITVRKETPLHVAAAGYNTEFVVCLMNMMDYSDLKLQNIDGNTAFCVATISGNINMVKTMVAMNSTLTQIRGSQNMMPLHLAAFRGNRAVVKFLYDQSNAMMNWTNKNINEAFYKCIQGNIFDVALKILEDKKDIPQDEYAYDVLLVLARNPEAFKRITTVIDAIKSYMRLACFKPRPALKESSVTLLLRLLWKRIMKRPKDVIDNILRGPMVIKNGAQTYPSQVLFISTEVDNTEFLVELIREYPDLIWKTNDDGQTIFHISISHRCQRTSNLLIEIGSIKDPITSIVDKKGNNILHLAAKKPKENVYEEYQIATPFQFYNELLWYKEVENLLPPSYRDVKNEKGQTPKELFRNNHEEQASKCVEGIHETINQSMVVATLVCAIGFSVIYQLPGGFDQSGFPIFVKNEYFQVYIMLSLVSFMLSTSSVILSLSIILSHNKQNANILLRRWLLAQILLLFSVLCLVFSFVVSYYVLYRQVRKGMLIFYSILYVGIVLGLWWFLWMELSRNVILKDATKIRRARLFRPGKPMLTRYTH